MSKIKKMLSNLYEKYVEEINEYEEYEEEVVEVAPEPRPAKPSFNKGEALTAKRMNSDFSTQLAKRPQLEKALAPEPSAMTESVNIITARAHFYDYTKDEKSCCHCSSSLEGAIKSTVDQWGISYVVCPSCSFVGRVLETGEIVSPSDDFQEMEHALGLFAQNGYTFKGFNAKENAGRQN